MSLTQSQIAHFQEDGFLVVERIVDPVDAAKAAARFEPIFRGEYEAGVVPDGMNFGEGPGADPLNRQIDNAWKCDFTVASIVLREEIGHCLAQIAGFPGARLLQDLLVWKLPGSLAVTMHQDSSYTSFMAPRELFSCWIALTSTSRSVGTIEYVQGSHKWGIFPMPSGKIYGNEDYRAAMRVAATRVGVEPEVVSIEAAPGTAVFHHAQTWHGSGPNLDKSRDRRSLVVQCASSDAHFVAEQVGGIYGQTFRRYKRFGDNRMDESFFPILWHEDGRRTSWLSEYMGRSKAH